MSSLQTENNQIDRTSQTDVKDQTEKWGSAFEYAGFWMRFGASLVDSIIILLVTLPFLFLIYGDFFLTPESSVQSGLDIIISYVMPCVATILFWVYKSATPGKMMFKLAVVDAVTGQKPVVKQSILRYIGYIVATIPFGLGMLWVCWDSKKQGWHDKMANTVVIRRKNGGIEDVSFHK